MYVGKRECAFVCVREREREKKRESHVRSVGGIVCGYAYERKKSIIHIHVHVSIVQRIQD